MSLLIFMNVGIRKAIKTPDITCMHVMIKEKKDDKKKRTKRN